MWLVLATVTGVLMPGRGCRRQRVRGWGPPRGRRLEPLRLDALGFAGVPGMPDQRQWSGHVVPQHSCPTYKIIELFTKFFRQASYLFLISKRLLTYNDRDLSISLID
ncbi:hypothetical protein NDU88_000650 [Pleurodeles waltl]|uniref:Secreted protein n=1 Tax=Pleurodeles waltl TaxID=8319 RepID=A0AAV7VYU0_PLEWA|nr:hypothetical protein NDU88_000650 [Pleurodeles waltl]